MLFYDKSASSYYYDHRWLVGLRTLRQFFFFTAKTEDSQKLDRRRNRAKNGRKVLFFISDIHPGAKVLWSVACFIYNGINFGGCTSSPYQKCTFFGT